MTRPAVNAARPAPNCWIDALKLMNEPRNRGSALPLISAMPGPKRPVTNTKNSTAHATTVDSDTGSRCVVIRMGAIDMTPTMRKHALLAVAIGEPADDGRGDERGKSAGEIHDRKIDLRQADVGDVIRRDEGNDGEARKHEHDCERKRAQVIRFAKNRAQLLDRTSAHRVHQVTRKGRQNS